MITHTHYTTHPLTRQSGAVLMVALVLMVILTMAGISALDSTKLETKMAANTREYNAAFQNAEVGVARALAAYKGEGFKKLPEDKTFIPGDSVSLKRGKVEYAVMMAGSKTAAENIGGGSMGIKFFMVRSEGNSLADGSGIPVTLYAGMSINTPSDSNQLNEVGSKVADATTEGDSTETAEGSGTGDSGSGSGTGDSGSGSGTGDSGSGTGDSGSGTGDSGSGTGDSGSGTGDSGSGTGDSGDTGSGSNP